MLFMSNAFPDKAFLFIRAWDTSSLVGMDIGNSSEIVGSLSGPSVLRGHRTMADPTW